MIVTLWHRGTSWHYKDRCKSSPMWGIKPMYGAVHTWATQGQGWVTNNVKANYKHYLSIWIERRKLQAFPNKMWCSGLEYSECSRLQVSTLKHQKNRILSRGTIVFGENISKSSEIKLIPTASLSITDPEPSHTIWKNKVDGTLRNWNTVFHEDTEVSKTSTLKTTAET